MVKVKTITGMGFSGVDEALEKFLNEIDVDKLIGIYPILLSNSSSRRTDTVYCKVVYKE